MTRILPYLLVVLGAVLGFPNQWLHFPPAVLGVPLGLAWIGALAPTARKALFRSWLASVGALTGVLYWIAVPVGQYGQVPWPLALPTPALLALYMALFPGLFGACMHVASRRMPPLLRCLFAGFLWAFLESLSGWLFTGFPWFTLAASFAFWPWAIQGAAYVGAYALSGVFAAMAVSLLEIQDDRRAVLVPVLLCGLLALAGWARLDRPEPVAASDGFKISVVQGNVDQSLKWLPEYQNATVDKYLNLSGRAVGFSRPQLLVWPETSMPFYFQDLTPLRTRVTSFAAAQGVGVLLGSPAYFFNISDRSYTSYNRAFLLEPDGMVRQWYDKEHLVPFGEYVPLGEWLPINKLVEGMGDFTAGHDQQPIVLNNARMGLLVCYEGVFPELAQDRVEAGANLLVSISNDAWFGRTAAPLQHLALTVMRCVEQQRWLARSTNTGYSAFIDDRGRVRGRTKLFANAVLSSSVRLETERTFFSSHFTAIRLCIGVVTLLLLGMLVLTGRNASRR